MGRPNELESVGLTADRDDVDLHAADLDSHADSHALLAGTSGASSNREKADDGARIEIWRCNGAAEALTTAAVCILYTLVGPMLIFTNKWLLSKGGFPYPLLITTLSQFSSAAISFVIVRVLGIVPLQHKLSWQFYIWNIATLGCALAITLCLGNSSYLFLSMAFIEILKGFAPVVTMLVQVLFGYAWPKPSHVAVVAAISAGTAIASLGEMHMDVVGLTVMFGSIYFEAVRLIMTKRLLGDKQLHVVEGLYYIAPASCFCVMLVALVIDAPRLDPELFLHNLPETWHIFLLVCVLGFAVNVSSFLVIQRTNVIMLKLLSISRNALVVVAGIFCFQETVTPSQFLGYFITLTFFIVYSVLQVLDHQ
mmetsp:Transcript_39372/g.86565  ORF Transcript_39372/g.86565 Transcript_39372/m.86565 type:complete len:366 (+) Transcript_39372:244-1341(+)